MNWPDVVSWQAFNDLSGPGVFPGIELAESEEPLYRDNEYKFQHNKESFEQHQHRVGCNTENFLLKVVLETVGIDEEVSAEEPWHSKTEKKTFQINNGFGEEDKRGESSEPFEEFSIWKWAGKAFISTLVSRAESERVKAKVREAEGAKEDHDQGDDVEEKSQAVVDCIPRGENLSRF